MSKVKMTMVCEEEQIRLIMTALEEYERLRIGQADMLVTDLSGVLDADFNDNREYKMAHQLDDHLKDSIEELIKYALIATGRINKAKTDKVRSAEDLWIGLRYAIWTDLRTDAERQELKWTVLGDKPLGYGEYPLAEIKMEYAE